MQPTHPFHTLHYILPWPYFKSHVHTQPLLCPAISWFSCFRSFPMQVSIVSYFLCLKACHSTLTLKSLQVFKILIVVSSFFWEILTILIPTNLKVQVLYIQTGLILFISVSPQSGKLQIHNKHPLNDLILIMVMGINEKIGQCSEYY